MVAIILLGAFTFHSPLVAFLLLPPFSPPLPSKSSLVSGERCKLPWLRTHYDAFKALKTHLVAKIRIFRRINHSTRYRPPPPQVRPCLLHQTQLSGVYPPLFLTRMNLLLLCLSICPGFCGYVMLSVFCVCVFFKIMYRHLFVLFEAPSKSAPAFRLLCRCYSHIGYSHALTPRTA